MGNLLLMTIILMMSLFLLLIRVELTKHNLLELYMRGEEMNNTFTLPLPKSINLKKALNKEQLYAAVLLVDRDGTILNAAKCKIPASTPNVIENIERNDSESTISEVFNLSGQTY